MRIGVDLGGTNVRAGVVDDGRIVQLLCEPCKSQASEQEVVEHIAHIIEKLMHPEIEAIGIGVPSVVDAEKGIVYDVISIPSWKEVHLKDILQSRFGIPVFVDNDCNCFAKGVCRYEQVRGLDSVVCVTLGTGVGAGLLLNGSFYKGANSGAGEIGCAPYLDKDYEFYCSSRFFSSKGLSGLQIYKKALEGDEASLKIWAEFGEHIGHLVMLIAYTYDPEALIFGGSIAQAFDLFAPTMYQTLQKFPYQGNISKLKIVKSEIDYIGLIGATL